MQVEGQRILELKCVHILTRPPTVIHVFDIQPPTVEVTAEEKLGFLHCFAIKASYTASIQVTAFLGSGSNNFEGPICSLAWHPTTTYCSSNNFEHVQK